MSFYRIKKDCGTVLEAQFQLFKLIGRQFREMQVLELRTEAIRGQNNGKASNMLSDSTQEEWSVQIARTKWFPAKGTYSTILQEGIVEARGATEEKTPNLVGLQVIRDIYQYFRGYYREGHGEIRVEAARRRQAHQGLRFDSDLTDLWLRPFLSVRSCQSVRSPTRPQVEFSLYLCLL